ncbi:hypothetical protein BKA80DRAFT_53658 [Phyllosticta citrichinensis]
MITRTLQVLVTMIMGPGRGRRHHLVLTGLPILLFSTPSLGIRTCRASLMRWEALPRGRSRRAMMRRGGTRRTGILSCVDSPLPLLSCLGASNFPSRYPLRSLTQERPDNELPSAKLRQLTMKQPTFIEAAERTCEVQANDCTTKANSNPQPDPQSNQNANNPKNTNLTGTQSNQNANNPKNTNLTGTQTHPKPAGDDPQKVELTVDKCEAQRTRCLSFQSKSASVTAFPDQTSTTTTTSSTSTTLSAAPTVNATTTSNGATMTVAGAPPPLPMPGKQPPGGPPGMGMMPLPPPPGAGPTGTQLINLGPDPQFPLFDLLCDV